MIKQYFYLRNLYIFTTCRYFNSSCKLSGKWFYNLKKTRVPPSKFPDFSHDWEHKIGLELDRNKPIKGVTDIEEYQNLPDYLRKAYCYNHLERKVAIEHEISEKAIKLGVDPVNHPLAYKIVRDTVVIRCRKETLQTNANAGMMAKTVRRMINVRKTDLHQLRSIDGSLFDKICKEFEIRYVEEEPPLTEAEPETDTVKLTENMSVVQAKKDKSFKEDLEDSAKNFFSYKGGQIEEIKENLRRINLNIEDVYDEVIKERAEKVMKPIYDEKYGWFEREKMLKIHYDKVRADKKEARERQTRR